MFDLYLAASLNKPIDQFIYEEEMGRLFSYGHPAFRRNMEDWEERSDGRPEKHKMFVDSGAYSAYTKGIEIDIESYSQYLNEHDAAITLAAALDKIPGAHGEAKTKEDLLTAPEDSWNNYLWLRERAISPDKILPVFHRREDFKWLHLMLDYRDPSGHPIPYIALAATTDSKLAEKEEWYERCFYIIKHSSNPQVKTHALGMTNLRVLEMYPFTSADSTSWLMTAANGGIMTDYGVVTVSEQKKAEAANILHLPVEVAQQIYAQIERFGFTIEQLASDYSWRCRYNIRYLKDWCQNYKFKGTGNYKKSLF